MIYLFDVGNVVIHADHKITHRLLERWGVDRKKAKLFYDNHAYLDFTEGRINSQRFYEKVTRDCLESCLTFEQIRDAHDRHLYGIDEQVVRLIAQLPKDKVVFLTNTNEWQTARERQLIILEDYGLKVYRSDEMKKMKPNRDCFEYVMADLGAEPAEIVIVDDSRINVEKAMKLGMNGIHFVDTNQLASEIKKIG